MATRKVVGQALKVKGGTWRAFFVSDSGRNIVHGTTLLFSSFSAGGYIIAHTWMGNKYQEIVQHFKHGFPTKVSQEMKDRVNAVLADMKISEKLAEVVEPFHVYGFEPLVIGSFKTTSGVRLGFPKYVEYTASGDIEREAIQVEGDFVKWHTEDGSSFADSLLLSEKAKKFITAQQLSIANSYTVFINAAILAVPMLGYQMSATFLNQKTFGFLRPVSYRLMLYTFCGAFWFGVYAACSDSYNKNLERHGDEEAAALGEDYARGGVEYYSKMLQRHMALRGLMGPNGEKMFTAFGNFNQGFRQKYIPITTRKDYLEKFLEKRSKANSDDSNNNNTIN